MWMTIGQYLETAYPILYYAGYTSGVHNAERCENGAR